MTATRVGLTAGETMLGQEQTPILCEQCLGPATPHADGSVVCSFCRHRGVLPHDQLQRTLELTRRLRLAANAVAQVQGTEVALSHVFESRWAFVRAAGMFLFLAVAMTVYVVVTSWQLIETAPAEVRATLLIKSAMAPTMIGGFGVAVSVALAVARRSYRRSVRPLMFARAPQQPGLPARCRACGGQLPDRRDPFVMCAYCNTHNLVTKEVEAHRNELLQREHQFYQNRASNVLSAVTTSAPNTRAILITACVLVYALVIGMAYLGNALLPS